MNGLADVYPRSEEPGELERAGREAARTLERHAFELERAEQRLDRAERTLECVRALKVEWELERRDRKRRDALLLAVFAAVNAAVAAIAQFV